MKTGRKRAKSVGLPIHRQGKKAQARGRKASRTHVEAPARPKQSVRELMQQVAQAGRIGSSAEGGSGPVGAARARSTERHEPSPSRPVGPGYFVPAPLSSDAFVCHKTIEAFNRMLFRLEELANAMKASTGVLDNLADCVQRLLSEKNPQDSSGGGGPHRRYIIFTRPRQPDARTWTIAHHPHHLGANNPMVAPTMEAAECYRRQAASRLGWWHGKPDATAMDAIIVPVELPA